MADRVSSDHPSVDTVRATLTETTTGVRIDIPAEERERFPTEKVVRLVLDNEERFVSVDRPLTGDGLTITAVYDSPRFAREPGEGVDRLGPWVADHSVRAGGSILLDIIEPEYLYGLRAPGKTAVYDAREPPTDSLASIAENLESGSDE